MCRSADIFPKAVDILGKMVDIVLVIDSNASYNYEATTKVIRRLLRIHPVVYYGSGTGNYAVEVK
ncbi:hypothetical protein [Bacillus multifaciens]|uniref:hypothetical protein n=1 Tax=Bacillus multifaciens TaxID=3068506 RepID=UPI002740E36D|nr:hypothetical protein [Bacillus sp. WLY-B-L8]MDP7978829.1 hypothetical protein [Bacillus sp. WLY-B-L8]